MEALSLSVPTHLWAEKQQTSDFRTYLEAYDYTAPWKGDIGNYNKALHQLMKDVGLDEPVRIEEKVQGKMVARNVPKWKLISSHTARRTAITVNVLRGHNIHCLKRCSGHTDLRVFDNYIRDE